MFEFFEKVAGEIGFKLINNFSNKVEEWIKRIFTECKEVDSEYNAKNASSGDNAQNASSGDNAQNASSGNYAQNVISGKNSISFDCGYKGIIKAVKGTWIALAEYKRNKCGDCIPIFARSAQIGNKEYKDFNGRVLKEDTYYILWQREFYPVIDLDGILTIK